MHPWMRDDQIGGVNNFVVVEDYVDVNRARGIDAVASVVGGGVALLSTVVSRGGRQYRALPAKKSFDFQSLKQRLVRQERSVDKQGGIKETACAGSLFAEIAPRFGLIKPGNSNNRPDTLLYQVCRLLQQGFTVALVAAY